MKARITIPDNLSEVSLVQYQDFLKKSENLEGDDLNVQMLSSFCAVDKDIVKTFKASDVNEFSTILNNMFNSDYPFYPKFKIDGVEFGFIPDLEDMSFGEYVDLDSYISDWSKMHKAMAILYRPITKKYKEKYEIEKYESSDKYSEVMKLMPLSCAFGSVVFFYRLGNDLLKAIPQFLEKQMKELTEISPNKANSISNGVGTEQFTNLLKEMSGDLTKLLQLDWRQP